MYYRARDNEGQSVTGASLEDVAARTATAGAGLWSVYQVATDGAEEGAETFAGTAVAGQFTAKGDVGAPSRGRRIELTPGQPACACPNADGVIRHERETCTDPVVARLGWYSDSQPSAAAPARGTEPCGECGGGYAQERGSSPQIPHAQECPQNAVSPSLPPLEALEALAEHGYGYPSARGLLHRADREGFALDGDVTVRSDEEHEGCFFIARQQPEPEAGA